MDSPLKKARIAAQKTLADVAPAVGLDTGNLSRIENCKQTASKETAEKLSQFYGGAVTEMEILYPERYMQAADAQEHSPAEQG